MSNTNSHNPKLYTLNAIGVGTFLGGPIAGGVMVRRNLLNLGRSSAAQPLLIALALSVVLFVGLAMMPSGSMERFPRSFLPALYTGLLVSWSRKTLGADLDRHKEANGAFFPGWKTFGVGLASLVATLSLAAACFALAPQSATDAAYQREWDRVVANESKAQELSTLAGKEGVTEDELVQFLDQTFLPAWDDSAKAVDEMESLKMLDKSTTNQRTALRKYVTLQQERGKLLREVLTTGDEAASKALDKVVADLEKVDLTAK